MNYQYILFDLDGTISDPKMGITKAVRFALKKYGIDAELDDLEGFIGPPLEDSFMEFYGFDFDKAWEAVVYYREYYRDIGLFENELFPDTLLLFDKLQEKGKKIILATAKPTVYAEQTLKHFHIEKYFKMIVGSYFDGRRTDKVEIIETIRKGLNIKNKKEMIMIGDRKYDIEGAKGAGIDSIGVLYGYGSKEEITNAQPTHIVYTMAEIYNIITGEDLYL
jgi:phosphoglycolate phosphatase